MPSFKELIQQLEDARQQQSSIHSRYLQSREQLEKIRKQKEALLRKAIPDNDEYEQQLKRLNAAEEKASASLDRTKGEFADAKKLATGVYSSFGQLSDPRRQLGQLKDDTPFLLFPVRIETRFKKVVVRDTTTDQLWIRIYPDDCLVDTFEEMLSETEVKNAEQYWKQQWEAGMNEDQERGAWRMLAGNHGSGRAGYILEKYFPVNAIDAPVKVLPEDIILVIAASQLPAQSDKDALAKYWKAIWLNTGDAIKEQEARDQLDIDAGSAANAETLLEKYTPFNSDATPPPPKTKAEVAVTVAFLHLPDSATLVTKAQSWSEAPSVNMLPEQFVITGYEGATVAFEHLCNPVPSPLYVAPDPGIKEEDQFAKDANGDIVMPEELRWMTDFNVAIQNGLGVKIPITAVQARAGFSRIVVLGVRLSADAKKGKELVEGLFDHHRTSKKGIAILQQGIPTNNTESDSSGHTIIDDPDESFTTLKKGKLFEPEIEWIKKKDGQWLAESLGIDFDAVNKISNSDLSDQAEARMMNTTLWPATLGYMMETLMQPVFDDDDIRNTRNFFNEYVSGRGTLPAIKIGKQPYGILPTVDFANIKWLTGRQDRLVAAAAGGFLPKLYSILKQTDEDWKPLLNKVSYVGKPGDAHQILLDALGLNPASVEYYQRNAESMEDLFNRFNMMGLGGFFLALIIGAGYVQSGMDLLKKYGYTDTKTPDILSKLFLSSQNLLKGPLIDDRPLSETEHIRKYTTDNKNYIEWLMNAAQTSHDTLRKQQGFVDSKIPTALLYLVMHHALDLSYVEVSLRLYEKAALLNRDQVMAAKLEPAFLHVDQKSVKSESKWNYLYSKQATITGNADMLIGDYIPKVIKTEVASQYMKEQLEAMDKLKDLPTARLERIFAEHMDLCSYRLDAWRSGIINYQLAHMRQRRNDNDNGRHTGIYIGAFGWVEEVKSENKVLTPVELQDPELRKMFIDNQEIPLEKDNKNGGHITAPSLDHALTASILRNGYTSNKNPDSLRINLSSERVRKALSVIEGIRGGQTLGALLGYYFERGLHEGYPGVELDYFIYQLRKAFPLTVNRMKDTKIEDADGDSVEVIEARNVVDGLALVNHVTKTGNNVYPFGKTNLPALDAPGTQSPAISKEIEKIRDINDAVADLAISESVYQAVLANYERANATLDTFSKGNFPPLPEVIQTPRSGTNLTHRVGLHLKPGLPVNAAHTARAQAEPAINEWLTAVLPAAADIVCAVSYNAVVDEIVSAADLGLLPIDILYIVNTDSDQSLKEIDDHVLKFVMDKPGLRPDTAVSINYMKRVGGKYSIFELAPYLASLRSILLRSRPLTPNDVSIAIEAKAADDITVFADNNQVRLRSAHTALKSIFDNDLTNYSAAVDPLMADTELNHDAIIAALDGTFIGNMLPILVKLNRNGLPQSGFGFVYTRKKEIFKSILNKVGVLATKWETRLASFDQALLDYAALPITTSDTEKSRFLQETELYISAIVRTVLPAIPDDYRDLLVAARPGFITKLTSFKNVATTAATTFSALLSEIKALLPIDNFDADAFELVDVEAQLIVFAGELQAKAKLLAADLDKRLKNADDLLNEYPSLSENKKKVTLVNDAVKQLFHEDFKLIPEFTVSAASSAEWANSFSDKNQLLAFLNAPGADGLPKVDFPEDEWLYGIARVREKLHHWENIVLLSPAFKRNTPELHPVQLPYRTSDSWLALEYPENYAISGDRLLYTAHYATPFNPAANQCGVLIDEWTEIIPAKDETIGVSFHYDKPNSEPPQAILLALPTEFTGEWKWQDLLNTVNETLNMAKRRAIEPAHVDTTNYARFLPAIVSSMTVHPLTVSLNFAFNNKIHEVLLNQG